jgi:ankyrin repeat protein
MDQTLFNLIKSHQYDKLISLIKNDDKIDLNIIDETDTYLVQYAILFRQKDLLALMITRNCKLDILDTEGKSIFYVPIKFGYIEIVKLLITFSNVVIGIPLLELQDDKLNIPLHYAIMFNKYEIINEMLDAYNNINFKDINGNTALHLLVKKITKENFDLLKKLLLKKISINHTNNYGQNALHIAVENNNIEVAKILLDNGININVQTINDHLTPLLIATIHNNIQMCELLINYEPNFDNQDIYGNSVLCHAILNKSKQMINLYYSKTNVNLVNISGQIAVNLFFDNDYDLNNLNEFYFDKILEMSTLNIQNNQGKTTWHYLTDYDVWENYYDILIIKRNKIFIQDLDGITPYLIIKKKYSNKMSKFIDLIANSFYNNVKITENKNRSKQSQKDEFDFIFKDTKTNAIIQIKNIIENKHISVPDEKKSYCINEESYENIKFSSYVGISLDIICGLIYIKNKFNNVETSLTTNFILNDVLDDYYKNNGIQRAKYSDFLNFEIIWSFHKLFMPTILKDQISNFMLDTTKRFLIIPVGIELSSGAHANILLYDKETHELERFEPYGKDYPPGFNYNPKSLDLALKNFFSNFFVSLKYFSPSDYETKIGLQLLDSYEYQKEKNIGDPGGFCAAWSLWYVEMRLNNINISRTELINKLINHIRMKQIPFRTIIRNFTKNIMDIRDKILLAGELDINKWLNDNFTEEQWNKIINEINKNLFH